MGRGVKRVVEAEKVKKRDRDRCNEKSREVETFHEHVERGEGNGERAERGEGTEKEQEGKKIRRGKAALFKSGSGLPGYCQVTVVGSLPRLRVP